jgi:hypothetical protein
LTKSLGAKRANFLPRDRFYAFETIHDKYKFTFDGEVKPCFRIKSLKDSVIKLLIEGVEGSGDIFSMEELKKKIPLRARIEKKSGIFEIDVTRTLMDGNNLEADAKILGIFNIILIIFSYLRTLNYSFLIVIFFIFLFTYFRNKTRSR